MSEVVALEFADPAGEPLRVEWSAEALASLVAPGQRAQPAWRLSGELDWDEVEALRVVSGRIGAGTLLAIAAVRPHEAEGHGDEVVAGAIGGPDGFDQLDEALVSTEYGPDGVARRIGLELYREEDGLPVRIAGDLVGTDQQAAGRTRRDTATFELRAGGDTGVGILDVITRAL
jgi:hypothetical protein